MFTRALYARIGSEPLLRHPVGLLFLLVWYFGSARQQAQWVKARHGASYRRKSWDSVLICAVVAGAACATTSTLLPALLLAIT